MNLARRDQEAKRFSLEKLTHFTSGNIHRVSVNDLEIDSRKILPGNAFVAVEGLSHDGRRFIQEAAKRGAAAVLMEPWPNRAESFGIPLIEIPNLKARLGSVAATFYDNPSKDIHTIGVTGTNGKTTTTHLIRQIANELGWLSGVMGTLGSFAEIAMQVHATTTQDAVTIQRTFSEWGDLGVELAAMEVSSHALEFGRVDCTKFDTAVFTNLSPDHLDFHKNMESYGNAKLKLFKRKSIKNVVSNFEDKFSEKIKREISPGVSYLTFSLLPREAADIRLLKYAKGDIGFHGVIETPWGVSDFKSPLLGECNLENLLAAVSSCLLYGASFTDVIEAIPSLRPIPGRLELLKNDCGLDVVIDYAHTPKALENAILALRPFVKRSLTTVFGCGGDRDRSKRPEMGRVACDGSDKVVLTSDNPRNESPEHILDEIEVGCDRDVHRISDRAQAISFAINQAQPGDCILIAGKGHEKIQVFGDVEIEFCDLECARDALEARC